MEKKRHITEATLVSSRRRQNTMLSTDNIKGLTTVFQFLWVVQGHYTV